MRGSDGGGVKRVGTAARLLECHKSGTSNAAKAQQLDNGADSTMTYSGRRYQWPTRVRRQDQTRAASRCLISPSAVRPQGPDRTGRKHWQQNSSQREAAEAQLLLMCLVRFGALKPTSCPIAVAGRVLAISLADAVVGVCERSGGDCKLRKKMPRLEVREDTPREMDPPDDEPLIPYLPYLTYRTSVQSSRNAVYKTAVHAVLK